MISSFSLSGRTRSTACPSSTAWSTNRREICDPPLSPQDNPEGHAPEIPDVGAALGRQGGPSVGPIGTCRWGIGSLDGSFFQFFLRDGGWLRKSILMEPSLGSRNWDPSRGFTFGGDSTFPLGNSRVGPKGRPPGRALGEIG